MEDLIQLCSVLSQRFANETREDGTRYVVLSGPDDEIKEAATAAIREAHDEELPNDWRFEVCSLAADAVAEASEEEELSDIAAGVAESVTTVSTSALLSWYADLPGRMCDAEEALSSGGAEDVTAALLQGQWMAAERTALCFLQTLEAQLQESNEEG